MKKKKTAVAAGSGDVSRAKRVSQVEQAPSNIKKTAKPTPPRKPAVASGLIPEPSMPASGLDTVEELEALLKILSEWDGKAWNCPNSDVVESLKKVILSLAQALRKSRRATLNEAVNMLNREHKRLKLTKTLQATKMLLNTPHLPLVERLFIQSGHGDKEAEDLLTALYTSKKVDLSRWRELLTPGDKKADLEEAAEAARYASSIWHANAHGTTSLHCFLMASGAYGKDEADFVRLLTKKQQERLMNKFVKRCTRKKTKAHR